MKFVQLPSKRMRCCKILITSFYFWGKLKRIELTKSTPFLEEIIQNISQKLPSKDKIYIYARAKTTPQKKYILLDYNNNRVNLHIFQLIVLAADPSRVYYNNLVEISCV